MKKLISVLPFLLLSLVGLAQTPEIGHFQQLKTVRRGDTLDVAWYYKPASGTDVRTFQVDFQYKKHLFTQISTTVDANYSSNSPTINFQKWENYKYNNYSSGTYNYTSDTNWTVGRNYLIFAAGTSSNSRLMVILSTTNSLSTMLNQTMSLTLLRLTGQECLR